MMKLLFFSFMFIFYNIKSQLKITYEVIYRPDSTKLETNVEKMSLKINNNVSYFYNETKFQLDSIYNKVTKEYERTGIAPIISLKYNLNYGIFKDFNKNEILEIHDLNNRNFSFKILMPYLNWELTNETKEKFNYILKKASVQYAGRKWIAWYSPEISINDGPYKFYGLPGLILEIYDAKKDYIFNAIAIKGINEIIKLPKNLINTSIEKFNELVIKINKDPSIFIRESALRNKNVKMTDTNGKNLDFNELFEKVIEEFNEFKNNHNNPLEKNTLWIK